MWEKKPFLFLLMATAAILVGTIITMVLPFAWVNTEADRIESVTPYSPIEQEGRDVYISEGCNNCHTQTIRPLVAEVVRYGEYSKSGEFVYDRPFLWGSKRTGPDLARIGGKYPDAWHYQHFDDPQSMIPKSNMPDHDYLRKNMIDPEYVRAKMETLGFPYTEEQISALAGKNQLDAMVAYMQKLGTDIPWRQAAQPLVVGEVKNPFAGDATAIAEGKELYVQHCAACHGAELEGDIGPELTDMGMEDEDLYQVLFEGIPDGGMPSFSTLGSERVWKMVNFINYSKEP